MTANISLILIPWSASDVWVQPPKWVIYHFHQILSGKQELPPQVWAHFPKKETFPSQDEISLGPALNISRVILANYTVWYMMVFISSLLKLIKKPFSRYKINASKTEKYPSRLKLCWEAGRTKQKPSLSDSFQKHNFSNRRNEMIRRWWVVYRTPTGSGNNGNHCPSQSL